MIVHVILFSPKPGLTQAARHDLLGALMEAASAIPAVGQFRVGRRVRHGLPGYEQMMQDDYEFAAIIEFADIDGLKAYLAHPAHAAIGRHFTVSAAKSLAYDYAIADAADAGTLLD